jgi:hypothetical protein
MKAEILSRELILFLIYTDTYATATAYIHLTEPISGIGELYINQIRHGVLISTGKFPKRQLGKNGNLISNAYSENAIIGMISI